MARKRDNNSNINPNLSLTSLLLSPPEVSPTTFDFIRQMAMGEIEDARQWTPDPEALPQTIRGPTSIRSRTPSNMVDTYNDFRVLTHTLRNPVMVCLRRKIRKEVMFAFNKTRKGSSSGKRRNRRSNYICR